MPPDWAKIHAALSEAWERRADSNIPKPPVPLILAGAAFSSASEIRRRWIDFVDWANDFGFAEVLHANLGRAPEIDVAEQIAGVSEDGRGWWPVYGEQFHKPKLKPSKEAVASALKLLSTRWAEIAGDELARFTRPLKFTGRKYRRLVVCADPEFRPPWGSWYFAFDNPRAFTRFRRAVNDAISPLEVDVIDFATHQWNQRAG